MGIGDVEDPRVTRTKAVVLDAATSLLAEGAPSFTVEAVAARSGVAKTTIYRHWPTRSDLLVAAIACFETRQPTPDTGSLRQDLIVLLGALARGLAHDDWARSLPAIIVAAEHDPQVADLHAHLVRFKSTAVREVLERAQARRELAPGVNVDLAMDTLAGPLFFRRLVLHRTTSRADVARLVDQLLKGLLREE